MGFLDFFRKKEEKREGLTLEELIKNNKKYEHIPIIVNSSMTTDAVRSKMNQIGVDGFVGKTDISTLFELTKEYLIR